jgi:hypothetical protein
MKQKVNGEDTKEKIGCNETPNLSFGKDQVPVKVQREGRYQIHSTSGGC